MPPLEILLGDLGVKCRTVDSLVLLRRCAGVSKQRAVQDRCELAMTVVVQVDAVQRPGDRIGKGRLRRSKNIGEGDTGLFGDLAHRIGVQRQILVMSFAVRKIGVPQILVGDG